MLLANATPCFTALRETGEPSVGNRIFLNMVFPSW
jgi:hypothetical protein